jgi:hypothetical protein
LLSVTAFTPGPFAGDPPRLQHRDILTLLTRTPPEPNARLLAPWFGYSELIDRRDVSVFVIPPTARAVREFDGARPEDLAIICPDLARLSPDWPEAESALQASERWRVRDRLNDVTIYEPADTGR